jgi:uracil phosphoribosyltransferase
MLKMVLFSYRHHPNNDDYFDILVQYQADLNEKNLLIVDPMRQGQSIVAVYNKLMERDAKEIHIAVVIAAPEGIASQTTYRNTAIFG